MRPLPRSAIGRQRARVLKTPSEVESDHVCHSLGHSAIGAIAGDPGVGERDVDAAEGLDPGSTTRPEGRA